MKRDVTGMAVEKAAKALARIRQKFQDRVPYGPGKVSMTSAEAKRYLDKLSQAQADSFKSMTVDEWDSVLRRLYGG